jgi:hypothetical protein
MVHDHFDGLGWKVPAMLDHVDAADEFYFGSMAIIGAARLADALQRHGVDHATAFQEYHDKLRPFVEEVQEKAVSFGMALKFPSDDAEMAERNRKLSEGTIDL